MTKCCIVSTQIKVIYQSGFFVEFSAAWIGIIGKFNPGTETTPVLKELHSLKFGRADGLGLLLA